MDASPPPATPRQPFADGEFLTRFPPGSAHALRLDCRHEKPLWQARLPASQTAAEFPGTAVYFDGRYYEVIAARQVADTFSYYLAPWDDTQVLRRVVELSPAVSATEAAARARAARERAAAQSILWLAPLVGLLPAELQERLERRHGVPASRLTAWSAAPLLAVSAGAFVLGLGQAFAVGFQTGGEAPRWQPVASYFMIESLLRLGAALAAGEANGSLPVVLAFRLRDLLRRSPRDAPPVGEQDALARHDEIERVEGEPPRLIIVSRLAKPHWSRSTGIRFEERWYRLLDAAEASRAGRSVHRFTLEEDPAALTMRGATDYDPREIVDLAWEKRRASQATWVETFAPLWGLLGSVEQERLASAYAFDARRSTIVSIVAAAAGGALATVLSARYLASGAGAPADVGMLALGLLLLADALRRALALGRGRVQASWLAPLVRPFCSRALSASSPPGAR